MLQVVLGTSDRAIYFLGRKLDVSVPRSSVASRAARHLHNWVYRVLFSTRGFPSGQAACCQTLPLSDLRCVLSCAHHVSFDCGALIDFRSARFRPTPSLNDVPVAPLLHCQLPCGCVMRLVKTKCCTDEWMDMRC